MRTAQVPADWPVDVKAAAVLIVIQELVEQIRNPRWKLAAQAAFRVPADRFVGSHGDSLAGRWRTLVDSRDLPENEVRKQADVLRGYWITAAPHLAQALECRLRGLNESVNGWLVYKGGTPQSPPSLLPISFDQTDVLYQFEGYRGIQYFCYRWLTAHDSVDHYEATGWYYNQPDAPVEIIPLANCTVDGPLRDMPQGGRCATLKFSHMLESGESYFFAYVTRFNSDRPCRPAIVYGARGLEMRSLTIRAQFDSSVLPAKCWHVSSDDQREGWKEPAEGAPELVEVASNGYVGYEFKDCIPGRKYALYWSW